MRRILLAASLVLAAAAPAVASGLPPLDLAGGQVAVTVGLADVGFDAAVGRLTLGASAAALLLPPLDLGYGFVGRACWRLSGLPGREPCFGLAVVGGSGSLGSLLGGGTRAEVWFVQPGLAVAWPLGHGFTLRGMFGPLLFTGVAGRGATLDGGTGLLPLLPNMELAIPIGVTQELTIGGLPGLLGWRGRF
jgi:hypothetical protein